MDIQVAVFGLASGMEFCQRLKTAQRKLKESDEEIERLLANPALRTMDCLMDVQKRRKELAAEIKVLMNELKERTISS